MDVVARVAPKDVTVLLTGESGSGKDVLATVLHAHSRRAEKPLIRFNAAAIPGELAEAELFGHTKGAFTGAQAARLGYFQQANKATLFIDEIGELPPAIQAKVPCALQSGEVQQVGGRPEVVDVRLIAATNRDLTADVKSGRFREDLFYRLNVVPIRVPALRERPEDIEAAGCGRSSASTPIDTEWARWNSNRQSSMLCAPMSGPATFGSWKTPWPVFSPWLRTKESLSLSGIRCPMERPPRWRPLMPWAIQGPVSLFGRASKLFERALIAESFDAARRATRARRLAVWGCPGRRSSRNCTSTVSSGDEASQPVGAADGPIKPYCHAERPRSTPSELG